MAVNLHKLNAVKIIPDGLRFKILVLVLVIAGFIFLPGCADTPSSPATSQTSISDTSIPDAPVPDTPTSDASASDTSSLDTSTSDVEDDAIVYVFAVGEALSVFIDAGDTEVLIDGGNDGGRRKDGGTVAEFIGDKIEDGILEYVIATHSHADHIGGLDEDIYEAFDVAHTIYGDEGTSKQYGEFRAAATSEENSEVHEDIDEVVTLADGVTLTIFDILDGDKNTNNNSVIFLFDYHGAKMLVTGDAEDEKSKVVKEALTDRLQRESVSNIDMYIVGHHGSETSSSEELLGIIKPEYAIISSVGPNHGSYNNPDISVLERLEKINAKIYATYISGDITITFNNGGVGVSPPESELVTTGNFADAA